MINFTLSASDAKGYLSAGDHADEVVCDNGKVIDNSFIEMLTQKFLNDDVPDAYQDCYNKSFEELHGGLGMLGFESEGRGISTDEIKASVKRDYAGFKAMLDEALQEAGISKDPAFEAKIDGSGSITIDSDHPDKEAIEKILNETRNLKETFNRMSKNSSTLAAIDKAEAYAKAAEIDPESAYNSYSYLFDEESCDIFSIFVSEDEYKPGLTTYGQDTYLSVFDEIMNGEYQNY